MKAPIGEKSIGNLPISIMSISSSSSMPHPSASLYTAHSIVPSLAFIDIHALKAGNLSLDSKRRV